MPPLLWGARLITVAAAIAAVCVIAAVAVSASNQTLRQEISERQQGINQGLMLSQINTRLANALALLAARDDDARIRSFLAQHGITVNLNPAPPSAAQLTGTK